MYELCHGVINILCFSAHADCLPFGLCRDSCKCCLQFLCYVNSFLLYHFPPQNLLSFVASSGPRLRVKCKGRSEVSIWLCTKGLRAWISDSAQTLKALKFAYVTYLHKALQNLEVSLLWVCHIIWRFNYTHETAEVVIIHCFVSCRWGKGRLQKELWWDFCLICWDLLCFSHDSLSARLHSWASNITAARHLLKPDPFIPFLLITFWCGGSNLTFLHRKKLEENTFLH